MLWVHLVTVLALIQFIVFGLLVGRARAVHKVPAPAMSGNDIFERYNRVHMNTLETLLVFLPGLWLAARYWSPMWMALLGVVYLVGRQIYLAGYVRNPGSRHIGYALSALPVYILIAAALIGVLRAMFFGGPAG